MNNIHDILTGEWLEIEFVGSGIVGRNGLRIVVDDNGLKAEFPDRPHGMDCGVVKLDPLSNADGAGAEDDDLFAVRNDGFVFRSIALFPQSQTGLRACVVKLRGLTDNDRAGADDEDLVNDSAFRHDPLPPSCSVKIP